MKILKFGGTSVANSKNIRQSLAIILKSNQQGKSQVVVSAMSGVTDQLIALGHQAVKGDEDYLKNLKKLKTRHCTAVKELISPKNQPAVLEHVKETLGQLENVLKGIFLLKQLSPMSLDFIMSFGERLSAYIIANAIQSRGTKAEFLDARKLLVTNNLFGSAKVDYKASYKNIRQYFKRHNNLQIITGFIAATSQGQTTTLGRGGSDYTAALFGAALNASVIEIWTDVDGVLTANPTKVPKTFLLEKITYAEAMELAHFGAKVIHPPTMQPALEENIPIRIKNTFNPQARGSVIDSAGRDNGFPIKGVSSIADVALVRLHGIGINNIAGITSRLFAVCARNNIEILLITQASSKQSICFAVAPHAAALARTEIEREFQFEIKAGRLEKITVETNLAIIAIVGEKLKDTPGIAGRIFSTLGASRINVLAIAQGSSELNIACVVRRREETKALNIIHDTFFHPGTGRLNLFVMGTGLIGGALLKQLAARPAATDQEQESRLNVAAIADSQHMMFDPAGIPLKNWRAQFKKRGTKTELTKFIQNMQGAGLGQSVFVDCTASDEISQHYAEILAANVSIVTPNKKANSGPLAQYRELQKLSHQNQARFMYEANVGAGLPVISTLKDLLAGGDEIIKIEGILSGTLSYIFTNFTGSKKFSDVIKEAKAKGFTEPDPRDDLNGLDVARKILILARECGHDLELKDIKIENLVPAKFRGQGTVEAFLENLKTADDQFEKRKIKAARNGKALRYIATLEKGQAKVGLEEIDQKHPFYSVSGSDNIISFTTKHYRATPLVIKGPGAGAEVTAAGIIADIMKLTRR